MRIAKYISNAGYCSRREAEKLINQKKVYINNICCNHPSTLVNEKDKIVIQNQIIKLQKKVCLWKMYKPKKTICTNSDPQNRKTIFSLIPKNYPKMISIGRLDFMSEGLILLTNNGEMARNYELPSSNIIRIYRVCINPDFPPDRVFVPKINKVFGIRQNHGIVISLTNLHIESQLCEMEMVISEPRFRSVPSPRRLLFHANNGYNPGEIFLK